MLKFSAYKIRRTFNLSEIENALVLLSLDNSSPLLNVENKELLDDVIFEIRKGRCNWPHLSRKWIKKDLLPPLELLWILEESNLLKTTTYLYFHPEYCSILSNLFSNALHDDFAGTDSFVLRLILSKILLNILIVRNNNDFKFLYEEIAQNLVSEAIEYFDSDSLKWNYLDDLNTYSTNVCGIQEFALLHLKSLLNYNKNRCDFPYVIGNHGKLWSSDKLSSHLKSFVLGFLGEIDPQTVIVELNNIVHQESFNWKNLLFFIAIFVREHKYAEMMKGQIDRWLINALEEKDKSLLLTTLIIARHCCQEKARYFVNYPSWFGSLSLKTVHFFSFFFECLSQIVPDEPPLYLKIHVNKVPSAPASCQSLIVDYLALAKTRLSDLNETTDYIGLFNDYHETDEEGQESDVQRAIKLFQENKEIPKPILEASVFRRQYYEKVFLKRLLSLSQNEDEQRAELIKKLYSAGKIPSTLYRSWSSKSLSFT